MTPRSFTAALLVLMVPAGCGTYRPPDPDAQMRTMMRPYDELDAQKAALWREGWDAKVFDFEGQGEVTVRRWQLVGWPGQVSVEARITYKNTTDHPVEVAFVGLEVVDSKGQVAGATTVRLVNPLGFPFWPGYTYTTWIKAPTNDAHLDDDGWGWRIACTAPIETDPGNKPVLINTDLEDARLVYGSRPVVQRSVIDRVQGRYIPTAPPPYPGSRYSWR